MSSRALKRLQLAEMQMQQKDNELDGDSSISEEDKPIAPRTCQRNIYELLNQDDSSEDEANEENQNHSEQPEAVSDEVVDEVAKSKKKKRKHKRRSKHVPAVKLDNEERKNHKVVAKDEAKNDASTSSAITKIQLLDEASGGAPLSASISKELIAVELRHLNQKNEIQRTFGKDLVKVEKKRNRQTVCVKPTVMVTGNAMWPLIEKNHITMKLLTNDNKSDNEKNNRGNSIKWFAFQYNAAYRNLQSLFSTAVDRMDFDFMDDMINKYYHLHTLMYMSELCKMDEDYATASEFIERALLAMESALHPGFSYTNGNCRLSYRCHENRPFFLLLFKHAQHLENRACCRTALEVAKLILNLNPEEDPLAMVLVLDYYALRSNEYKWLIKFYEQLSISRHLSQLPNMIYSYALALFLLEGETVKANLALQNAILTYPGVLQPLLNEMSVQIDKRVATHPYLGTGISNSQSAGLYQLVCLYVCRAKYVWRANNTIKWLEKNVHTALDVIDKDSSLLTFYNAKRIHCYIDPPLEVLRHVILSDFRDKVPMSQFIRKDMVPILLYDPLPPRDTDDLNVSNATTNTEHCHQFVSMFFRSFLPMFNTSAGMAGPYQFAYGPPPPVMPVANEADVVDEVERLLEELNHDLDHDEVQTAVGSQQPNINVPEDNID